MTLREALASPEARAFMRQVMREEIAGDATLREAPAAGDLQEAAREFEAQHAEEGVAEIAEYFQSKGLGGLWGLGDAA